MLVVNQNFFPGWRGEGTVEGPLVDAEGLLSLTVPPGSHKVTLRYRPWTVGAGALLSLLSLALAALWLARASPPAAPAGRGPFPAPGVPTGVGTGSA